MGETKPKSQPSCWCSKPGTFGAAAAVVAWAAARGASPAPTAAVGVITPAPTPAVGVAAK